MANPDLAKTYNAEANIPPYTIVKFGANDFGVTPGAASTDTLVGVSTNLNVLSGNRVDIYHEDIAYVKLGGTVTRGNFVTSDVNGNGVAAAPGAGINAGVVGIARQSGVVGDVIEVLLGPGRIQG
jgi:hypothetical protein